MVTENMKKVIPVIEVPPEQNNPHIIQPATASKYEVPLSKKGAKALEKYYREHMPDTKDMTSRQIERIRMELREKFIKMRQERVVKEAANMEKKKKSIEAYVKRRDEKIFKEQEKEKKVEQPGPSDGSNLRTQERKAVKRANKRLRKKEEEEKEKKKTVEPLSEGPNLKMRLNRNGEYEKIDEEEEKKKSLTPEPRYPERNEHFISQPVYPEPIPFQQNNLYPQNDYQQYQQGYQQSFEPVRNEYQQSGMFYEQPNNWVDRTWRGQDEYRTYPSSSFSAYSQSAGPSQAQTVSNFYGQPAPNFDTSYTPFMPDLISQAASAVVSNQPMMSSYQQPDRYVSPPITQRTLTSEVEKVAMQQQRLLEIEKELQIIEHQKMESAMEQELRRRTDELKDREHWIAVRERQLYEMERNNERRWNEESYHAEPSSSQSRRQRARNRTTTSPDVVTKKRQRGSVMKHFGPSTSSVSTTSANAKKSSMSAANSNRFGRIQDAVKLK